MATTAVNQVRRVELILQQIDTLPTLSTVAMRLLELTTSEDSHARDVIEVVASDPAMASKVLKLCRCHERGRASYVSSVDRAVVLLGFDAVRSAALSVQVFEVMDTVPSVGGERRAERAVFDRLVFWQHSLAVAICCERLAKAGSVRGARINAGEAFLAGLLHDLGQLALHVALPTTFDKVCETAESHGVSLDHACTRVIGIDTHTAGKRLAEHWHLPHSLIDVMWLNGQPFRTLPDLPHKSLIGIVTLADAIARCQHIAPAGHAPRSENLAEMCAELEIDEELVNDLIPKLYEEVNDRAEALGIPVAGSSDLLLQSIGRANEVLGRINTALQIKTMSATRHAAALRAIAQFHKTIEPGLSVVGVLGKIVTSATEAFGEGFFSMLYQASDSDPWQLLDFANDGRLVGTRIIGAVPSFSSAKDLADDTQLSLQALELLPLLKDSLSGVEDPGRVRLLPLRCGWGVSAVLVHDCQLEGRMEREQLEAMGRTWGAAIAAAAQHAGAKRLGEQLAQANRALTDTQDELARSQTLAALGEVAAGAAHEMNNPLTVISGRSQILVTRLQDLEMRSMAEQIMEQSHRLSNMISALRVFAEPVKPVIRPVDIRKLLEGVVAELRPRIPDGVRVQVSVPDGLAPVHLDPVQIADAVSELVRNAIEAQPALEIQMRVQTDPADDRLMIQVADDGPGLSDHALAHAFDPFFSAKPAGRQPGLGLARARQLVEAHGGQLTLKNGPGRGALATIWLRDWRGQPASAGQRRGVA